MVLITNIFKWVFLCGILSKKLCFSDISLLNLFFNKKKVTEIHFPPGSLICFHLHYLIKIHFYFCICKNSINKFQKLYIFYYFTNIPFVLKLLLMNKDTKTIILYILCSVSIAFETNNCFNKQSGKSILCK